MATNASSLMTDSNAIASTIPWWFSVLSTSRVPNRIANAASIAAISIALSMYWTLAGDGDIDNTSKPNATAFNCSAM